MDIWVLNSQTWVNNAYRNVPGFVPAPNNGVTGWKTMFALTRALQWELGITALSDDFGPATFANLTAKFPTITSSTANANIRAIVQCGLWCKGYSGGGTFGTWESTTTTGIASMRSNLGLTAVASITPKMFKSLLTMDAYVVVPGGTSIVRSAQQSLNSRYSARRDFSLIPCDGLYSRDVQTGLMYALQYEIGMVDGVANGNLGPGTKAGLIAFGNVTLGSSDSSEYFVHLFQAALAFNGYYDDAYDGTFSAAMKTNVQSFQSFMLLPQTGRADFQTWAALLISTGDPDRPASGFDCSQTVTGPIASQLQGAGFKHAIRYLNGNGAKRIAHDELPTIWSAGMKWAPVYQEFNNASEEFSEALGTAQGQRMCVRLRQLGVNSGALGYLAVDFDATGGDIDAVVLPHFRAVKAALDAAKSKKYRLGVYATRNVCNQLAAEGLTESSFVSDMSTGYSGNLGFRMPTNWSYDQIQNVDPDDGGPYSIEIDRDVASPRAQPLGSADIVRTPRTFSGGVAVGYDEAFYWPMSALQYLVEASVPGNLVARYAQNHIILNWLQKPEYWGGANDGLIKLGWATAVTPPIWQWISGGGIADEVKATEAYFEGEAGNEVFPHPALHGRFGDIMHWAASTRAHMYWGAPSASPDISVSDCASWGGDLIQTWNDYENYRVENGNGPLDVRTWAVQNIGGTNGRQFDAPDLRADMAAYIAASRMNDNAGLLLEDVICEMLVAIEDDPGWLAKTYYPQRFGTRATLKQATWNLFTSPWPLNAFAREMFLNVRAPGTVGNATNPPPTAVLERELSDLADGFADALEIAQSWTER